MICVCVCVCVCVWARTGRFCVRNQAVAPAIWDRKLTRNVATLNKGRSFQEQTIGSFAHWCCTLSPGVGPWAL